MTAHIAKRFAVSLLITLGLLTTFSAGASAATSTSSSLQLLSSSSQFQYLVQAVNLGTVVTGSPIGPLPTGTITFYDQKGPIGSTSSLTAVHNFAYIATSSFSTSALSVGSHTIHSVYSGDSYYAGSSTGTQTITITPATTQTTLTVNPTTGTATPGQHLTLIATVTSTQLSGSQITGTVTFSDGGSVLGTAALNGSSVSLATSLTSLGTHQLTAAYSGSANITGSSSPAKTVSVQNSVSVPPTTPAPPGGGTSGSSGGPAAAPVASTNVASNPATAAPAPSTTPASANQPLGSVQGQALPATVFDKGIVPPIEALELGAASGIAFGKALLLTPFLIPLNVLGLLWLAYAWRRGRRLSRTTLTLRGIAQEPRTDYASSGVSTARQQYQATTER